MQLKTLADWMESEAMRVSFNSPAKAGVGLARVIGEAVKYLRERYEKQKHGATTTPTGPRGSRGGLVPYPTPPQEKNGGGRG